MAITKVINDAVDLNQTSDYSGLRLPVGTTGNVVESFTTDYLVVGGGGSGGKQIAGGGGGGGLRTSYNNSTTTTNSLSFPSGKTAIATYMLDNNVTDVSGNYNGGDFNITYNTGQYGGAAVFNGSSSYINLPNLGTEVSGSNTRTLSAWVKLDSNPSVYSAVVSYGAAANLQSFGIYISSTGTPRVSYYNINYDTSTTLTLSNWHHIVGIYKGGNVQTTANTELYIDGQIQTLTATNSLNLTGPINTSNTNYAIGYYRASPSGSYFNGDIDQVRIYDTALSSTDVSNIYTNEVQANSGGGSAAESSLALTAGVAYNVTVGEGGASVTAPQNARGNSGQSSIFSTITSLGGGGGGTSASPIETGLSGGSGGGSARTGGSGGAGTIGQGYAGGAAAGSSAGTQGGGGGASSLGVNGSTTSPGTTQGNGGTGLEVNIIGGTGNYYASGGGGGTRSDGYNFRAGTASAGGGTDGTTGNTSSESGVFNTGGGSGGTGYNGTSSDPGSGGSGVVILRYPTASVSSFTTTGTLNTPSTTNTVADNNYPTTNTAYYQLDGNANGYLTTNDLGTLDYPSGTGCIALYELNGNTNGYLTTTDLSTVNYPVGAGCVALYELNGNANDTSNTYNGSATNVTYNTGAFDQAAVFNGSSSRIATGLTLPADSTMSFSFWLKSASNSSGNNYFLSDFDSSANNNSSRLSLAITPNNGLRIWISDGSSNWNSTDDIDLSSYVNLWMNLVVVINGTDVKVYINGGTPTTLTSSVAFGTAGSRQQHIGRAGDYNGAYYEGSIDQVRIFNTALTQSQVTTLARGVGSAYNGVETNITYDTGAFGKAAVFNGSSSFITLPGSMLNSLTAISASAWVYRRTGSSDAYEYVIAGGYNVSGGRYGIAVDDAGGGSTDNKFYITDGAASYHTNTVCAYNTWYHVVLTWAGTEMKFYVNGSLDSTFTVASCNFQSSGNGHKIGEYFYNGTYEWSGEIDQVRIFNTALSASNIATLARGAGTANNGAASNITWQNGRFGQAAVFNGSSSYITTPSLISTNNFSFSCWVNMNSFPGSATNQVIFVQNENNNRWYISVYESGKIQAWNGATTFTTSSSVINLNQWHNVVYTADSSNGKKIYVDNVEVLSSTDTGNNQGSASGNLFIGFGKWYANSLYLDGKLDQVRIFSSALTSSQGTQLYNEHYQTKFTDGSDTAIVFTEGTGTVTFSGISPAPPQGALRTNTSYSEDGSASVIEHYNGTDWKYFDAIKYCTTNTLNFPSGAGCIASYNLDNNVNDIGNTYNGVNSNVTFNASGKFGAAAVFNGSSSEITVSSFASLSQVGISMWVNMPNISQQAGLIARYGSTREFAIYMYGGTLTASIYYNGSNGNATSVTASTYMSNNTWHHISYNSDGVNQPRLYIDGAEVGTAESNNNTYYTSSEPLDIGHFAGISTYNYEGKIDQVRIFNDSLTSAEVLELYNNEIACS